MTWSPHFFFWTGVNSMNLEDIASVSRFKIEVFNGKLHLEGRILSVAEAESAGMASGLIIAALAPPEDLVKLQEAKTEEDRIVELLRMSKQIRPEQMGKLAEENDRILCKVIRRASMDGGKTWEKLTLVNAEEQQDPKENRLWVGVFNSEDREAILENALQGHEVAAKRIASFHSD